MTLSNLSEAELIASAGGDPWAINQSLQAGSPFQISQLAEAFHGAGRHTAEADHAFEQARKRFAAAWNHQDGGHPINDSEEVQRVTKALGAQSEQLPKIGAELETIAAALADAQKQGAREIALLDSELRGLDSLMTAIKKELASHLPESERQKLLRLYDDAHADAVDDVRDAVKQMTSIRNGYSDTLRRAMGALHTDGYDPPKAVDDTMEQPLRGMVRNLGPIAGTGSNPGIPGIGAADLGEVVEVPGQPGKYLAIFGDAFSGNKVGEGLHYRSVAVPVTFDADGRPHFGAPLTGAKDSGHELFPIPSEAPPEVTDTLPAGTITLGDKTYMMVTGTKDGLTPVSSWLVEVNGDPGKGWTRVPGSYRTVGEAPTQISGYKGQDGKVYIAADSFDRSQGVTMYQADPNDVTNRAHWQPWNGTGWGKAGDIATVPVTDPGVRFGELSFREVGGQPVLSGFNATAGPGAVQLYVGNSTDNPIEIFSNVPTTLAHNDNNQTPVSVMQPYGGYILPNSTLNNMNVLVSQWDTKMDTPYNVQQVQVSPAGP